MEHNDPRVDRSRGAVYQAEDSVASVMRSPHRSVRLPGGIVAVPAELRFGTLEAVQRYVDQVLSHPATVQRFPGRGMTTVEVRRGFRAATYSSGRIQVPAADPRGRWALTRSVVLHECAHHLAGVPGHGPAFRAALVHLYSTHLGDGAAALLEHLFAPIDSIPEPSAPDDGVRRVAALLAKAESTTSAEEADAYVAKAALVAQRHSIDMAVAAWAAGASPDRPTHRMLTIGQPRATLNKHLVSLLVTVARAWGIPVDIGHGSTYVILFGMPGDLDHVESVFVTASTLMVGRATEHVRSGAWKGTTYVAGDGSRPATRPVTATVARNAFCLGFIARLSDRLARARAEARSGLGTADGSRAAGQPAPHGPGRSADPGERASLALRARELEVADYHRATSRARGRWRGSATAAGTAVGSRRAGERAAEEYGRRGIGGQRRAISS